MRTTGAKQLFRLAKRWSLHNDVAADILRMRQEVRKIDKPFGQLSEEELMLVYRLAWRLVDLCHLNITFIPSSFRKESGIRDAQRENMV